MPVSRSPSRDAKPSPPAYSIWPWILIALGGVFAVIVVALPASIVGHFFPPSVHAEDFSGSVWHGSAGKITLNGRDAGALEWRLHPAALLRMTLAADLHWVKVGFVIDGATTINRRGYLVHDITGGGPIEDLQDFGVAAGWRGNADIKFSRLEGDFAKPAAAVGEITVLNLTSAQIAMSADLGSYALRLPAGAVSADGSVNAELSDSGGPVEIQAHIRFAPTQRTGMVSGTLRERADAPQALRTQLDSLSQLRGRDPQGWIPIDLEFTF
jgi:hypothetical protein